jgi:DNA-3-methyladenine glycosylase II
MSRTHNEIAVVAPYRLDLTMSVLRRLSRNVVDVLTSEREYVRALGAPREPVIARVAQVRPEALTITLEGDKREHRQALVLVRRMLGVDWHLAHFDRAVARIEANPHETNIQGRRSRDLELGGGARQRQDHQGAH